MGNIGFVFQIFKFMRTSNNQNSIGTYPDFQASINVQFTCSNNLCPTRPASAVQVAHSKAHGIPLETRTATGKHVHGKLGNTGGQTVRTELE